VNPRRNPVPHSIDLSALVRRTVASLYSHLVTRPTGHALRLGIESQIAEMGGFCVSVLDFAQVVVLDYSCADEAVAKLILRYQREDRPSDAYFVARGLAEQHVEPIEEVLARHDLALVAEIEDGGYTLLGQVTEGERHVWNLLHEVGTAAPDEISRRLAAPQPEIDAALTELSRRRALLRRDDNYVSLTALLS